jgi:hypothetical protein
LIIQEKPDAKDIREHIEKLKKETWLGPARKSWLDFLFHFTDVQNAASILKDGLFLSRNKAIACKMITDNASPDVIENTDNRWKDYVRLYFRPRTPTQFNNEGCRPTNQWTLNGAHCPVPVYFLLDSKAILSRHDSLFSEGNLAAGACVYSTAKDFKELPFNNIYHNSPLYEPEKSSIIFHRCAEVIIPEQLDLTQLKYIWCRSQAEVMTLLYLLPQNIKNRWINRIGISPRSNLFFCRWTYVEDAQLNENEAILTFNSDTETPGPFKAFVKIYNVFTGEEYSKKYESFFTSDYSNNTLRIKIPIENPQDYMLNLFLDGQLAFAGRYQEDKLPF